MNYHRKTYIINKGYQFRMLGTLLVLVLLATLIITLVNHYFMLSSTVDHALKYGRTPAGDELFAASFKPAISKSSPALRIRSCFDNPNVSPTN